jgi:DNA-binding transcriptional MocR family regulator
MLDVNLNRERKLALYNQIAEQIKEQISDGRLPANTRLPTVRQFAQELGVTRLTIQNAYSELQADGWIEATVGRGTFVSPSVQPMTLTPTIGQYLTPDHAINDMLELDQIMGVRSMAMAHPDPTLFPTDEFWQYLIKLQSSAHHLLGYGPIHGDTELRVILVTMLAERGITAVPEDILVTSGTMQGISLVAQTITQPGDTVLVDSPTFLGTLSILEAQRLHHVTVPLDEEGPMIEAFEQALRQHSPRFYYAIPHYHNPTGICMSPARRQAILLLARQYNCLIVEDDIYGRLAFDETPPPTLKSQDNDNIVIYLSGFSKIFMPGLRAGFVIMPRHLQRRMLTLRRATDLCGPIFVHRALAHFLRDGGLKRHLRRVLPIYKERRDTLMAALHTHMPTSVHWSKPKGGFCCWVSLPRYFGPGELYRMALQNGFAFTPGEAYLMESTDEDYLRLCFGNQNTTGIQAGVKVLGELIRRRAEGRERPKDFIPMM